MSSREPSDRAERDALALPEPTPEDVAALRRARDRRVTDFGEWLQLLSALDLPAPRWSRLPAADAEPFSLVDER